MVILPQDNQGSDQPAASLKQKPEIPIEVLNKWQRVVDLLAGMLLAPSATVTRGDATRIEIMVTNESPDNPYRKEGRVEFDEGFRMYCQIAMEQKTPLYVPDAQRDPRWERLAQSPDLKLGMICYLGFPLLWPDGEVYGTLCVMDRHDNPKIARHMELVRQCGEGIEDDLKVLVLAAAREEALRELRKTHAELEQRVKQRTGELQQTNTKLIEVLESITDAFIALDRQWCYTYINAKATELLGGPREAMLGRRVWDQFPDVVGTEGYIQAHRTMEERVPTHFEIYVPSLGRWLENHVHPTKDGVSVYFTDITARKVAEQEAELANARVRDVVESITDAFVAVDRNWRFTYVNARAAQVLGKSREELMGQGIWDLVPELVGTEGYNAPMRAMAEGVPAHYETFVPSMGRWFESHAYPTKDGLVFYGHDITDKKRAEDESRHASEKVTEVLESITDVFVELDREWRYTYVNDRATQFLGIPREELIGRSMWEVLPELRDAPETPLIRRAMSKRVPVHYETLQARHGRWLDVYAYPTGQDGLAFYAREITDRKRAEEATKEAKETAEAASRAKDQFMAVLSHELRTPLTPVLAAVTELEATTDLPERLKENVDVLRRNVEMEARLIDDLLDVTRIARGKIELHPEVVDVHESIRRAMDICRPGARDKGVELTANLQTQKPYVWGDPARLQQVFWNLLTNAIKFTPTGGSVRVVSIEEDGRINVQVTDTGIGIEREMLPQVFNAFEQAERTKVRRYGGLGLGLTIVKNLVTLHGGRVTAASEGKDKGATFTVELATVPTKPKPKDPIPAAPHAGTGHQRILLVEDHPDTLRVMSRLLKNLGYTVSSAASVRTALEIAEKEKFDLLISDLGLPDGSGLDVMRQMKGRYGLKGLAISGFGTEDDIRQSREAGFQQLLTKPVDFNTLETAVRQMTA